MKTFVLLVAKRYLADHQKKGELTRFADKFLSGVKKTTIRNNYDYWSVRADEINEGRGKLSLRQWIGKPYKKDGQYEFAEAHQLNVDRITMAYDKGVVATLVNGMLQTTKEIEQIAIKDGFKDLNEFNDWFLPSVKKKQFNGCILTPIGIQAAVTMEDLFVDKTIDWKFSCHMRIKNDSTRTYRAEVGDRVYLKDCVTRVTGHYSSPTYGATKVFYRNAENGKVDLTHSEIMEMVALAKRHKNGKG